jgi:AcrR family transcriptional regulator
MTAQSRKTPRTPRVGPSANPIAQRIVTAAREDFLAHGLRSVTMDDLAAKLGMSKKTLYAEFPSKTDLLRAVLLDKFASLEADLERIIAASPGNALAELQQLLACMQRHTEEIQPAFARDIRRESPELFELVENRRRGLIQRYFGRIFDDGRREKFIRSDISTEMILEILLGAVQAIMNPVKIETLGITPKAGYGAIVAVILEGVLTAKGRAK